MSIIYNLMLKFLKEKRLKFLHQMMDILFGGGPIILSFRLYS